MAKILLVEPDIPLAETYSRALIRAGHDAMWCITARQAILGADDTYPDMVVLEPQLAEHGGIEFLYEFRSYPEWDAVPIIIFSRLPADEFPLSAAVVADLGIRGYWHKPRYPLVRFVRTLESELVVRQAGAA